MNILSIAPLLLAGGAAFAADSASLTSLNHLTPAGRLLVDASVAAPCFHTERSLSADASQNFGNVYITSLEQGLTVEYGLLDRVTVSGHADMLWHQFTANDAGTQGINRGFTDPTFAATFRAYDSRATADVTASYTPRIVN